MSLRDIIYIGIKAVIGTITTIIAASLVNTTLFGNYDVDFMFVMGNMFNLTHGSPLYTAYIMILQEETKDNIGLKEKETQCFILEECLYQLLQPVIQEQPYMYNSFSTGILHQVASATYAIRVTFFLSGRNGKFT